ncbi:MAG: M15 family metallopeptidase [Gammaproteobacteria bacterium]
MQRLEVMDKNINRRQLLKGMGLVAMGASVSRSGFAWSILPSLNENTLKSNDDDGAIRDYLQKIRNFDQNHQEDIWIDRAQYPVFESVVQRLRRLQRLVGYGNFNILSLTDGLRHASNFPDVGEFTRDELAFLESIFYAEGRQYGFLGQKPLKDITDSVREGDVFKVPYSGHYLYKERSLDLYEVIKKELGDQVVLTSGVRGVMKQFLLFLNKAHRHDGNLSLASRSLAPPGYSFHGNGDFDVGQKGYGEYNFTERFTETEVYKRLSEMGYLQLRYPEDNQLGVRYEPWHIKIKA